MPYSSEGKKFYPPKQTRHMSPLSGRGDHENEREAIQSHVGWTPLSKGSGRAYRAEVTDRGPREIPINEHELMKRVRELRATSGQYVAPSRRREVSPARSDFTQLPSTPQVLLSPNARESEASNVPLMSPVEKLRKAMDAVSPERNNTTVSLRELRPPLRDSTAPGVPREESHQQSDIVKQLESMVASLTNPPQPESTPTEVHSDVGKLIGVLQSVLQKQQQTQTPATPTDSIPQLLQLLTDTLGIQKQQPKPQQPPTDDKSDVSSVLNEIKLAIHSLQEGASRSSSMDDFQQQQQVRYIQNDEGIQYPIHNSGVYNLNNPDIGIRYPQPQSAPPIGYYPEQPIGAFQQPQNLPYARNPPLEVGTGYPAPSRVVTSSGYHNQLSQSDTVDRCVPAEVGNNSNQVQQIPSNGFTTPRTGYVDHHKQQSHSVMEQSNPRMSRQDNVMQPHQLRGSRTVTRRDSSGEVSHRRVSPQRNRMAAEQPPYSRQVMNFKDNDAIRENDSRFREVLNPDHNEYPLEVLHELPSPEKRVRINSPDILTMIPMPSALPAPLEPPPPPLPIDLIGIESPIVSPHRRQSRLFSPQKPVEVPVPVVELIRGSPVHWREIDSPKRPEDRPPPEKKPSIVSSTRSSIKKVPKKEESKPKTPPPPPPPPAPTPSEESKSSFDVIPVPSFTETVSVPSTISERSASLVSSAVVPSADSDVAVVVVTLSAAITLALLHKESVTEIHSEAQVTSSVALISSPRDASPVYSDSNDEVDPDTETEIEKFDISERDELLNRISELEKNLQNITTERDDLLNGMSDLRTELEKVISERDSLLTRISDLEKLLDNVTSERDDLLNEVTDLKLKIQNMATEIEHLISRIAELEKALEEITAERDELLLKLSQMEKERDMLSTRLCQVEEDYNNKINECDALKNRVAELEAECDALRKRNGDLEGIVADQKAIIDSITPPKDMTSVEQQTETIPTKSQSIQADEPITIHAGSQTDHQAVAVEYVEVQTDIKVLESFAAQTSQVRTGSLGLQTSQVPVTSVGCNAEPEVGNTEAQTTQLLVTDDGTQWVRRDSLVQSACCQPTPFVSFASSVESEPVKAIQSVNKGSQCLLIEEQPKVMQSAPLPGKAVSTQTVDSGEGGDSGVSLDEVNRLRLENAQLREQVCNLQHLLSDGADQQAALQVANDTLAAEVDLLRRQLAEVDTDLVSQVLENELRNQIEALKCDNIKLMNEIDCLKDALREAVSQPVPLPPPPSILVVQSPPSTSTIVVKESQPSTVVVKESQPSTSTIVVKESQPSQPPSKPLQSPVRGRKEASLLESPVRKRSIPIPITKVKNPTRESTRLQSPLRELKLRPSVQRPPPSGESARISPKRKRREFWAAHPNDHVDGSRFSPPPPNITSQLTPDRIGGDDDVIEVLNSTKKVMNQLRAAVSEPSEAVLRYRPRDSPRGDVLISSTPPRGVSYVNASPDAALAFRARDSPAHLEAHNISPNWSGVEPDLDLSPKQLSPVRPHSEELPSPAAPARGPRVVNLESPRLVESTAVYHSPQAMNSSPVPNALDFELPQRTSPVRATARVSFSGEEIIPAGTSPLRLIEVPSAPSPQQVIRQPLASVTMLTSPSRSDQVVERRSVHQPVSLFEGLPQRTLNKEPVHLFDLPARGTSPLDIRSEVLIPSSASPLPRVAECLNLPVRFSSSPSPQTILRDRLSGVAGNSVSPQKVLQARLPTRLSETRHESLAQDDNATLPPSPGTAFRNSRGLSASRVALEEGFQRGSNSGGSLLERDFLRTELSESQQAIERLMQERTVGIAPINAADSAGIQHIAARMGLSTSGVALSKRSSRERSDSYHLKPSVSWDSQLCRGVQISQTGKKAIAVESSCPGHILMGMGSADMLINFHFAVTLTLGVGENRDVLVGLTTKGSSYGGPTYFYRGDGCKIADDGDGVQKGSKFSSPIPAGTSVVTCEVVISPNRKCVYFNSKHAFTLPSHVSAPLYPMVVLGAPPDAAVLH